MRRCIFAALLAMLLARGMACCQATDRPLAFEVASVKPQPDPRGREQVETSPGSLTIRTASLSFLIQWAYGVRSDQVAGPSWLRSDFFDLTAKAASPASASDLRRMLQSLLAERFQLDFHRETRELAVYELTVGKGGPKLKESAGPAVEGPQSGRDHYDFLHVTMQEFGRRLREFGAVDLPVVDRTGLGGVYDITLSFPGGLRPGTRLDPHGDTIFRLLENQLGLKLELRKSPGEVLVVDRAERVPREN